jgi:hypothetical protein
LSNAPTGNALGYRVSSFAQVDRTYHYYPYNEDNLEAFTDEEHSVDCTFCQGDGVVACGLDDLLEIECPVCAGATKIYGKYFKTARNGMACKAISFKYDRLKDMGAFGTLNITFDETYTDENEIVHHNLVKQPIKLFTADDLIYSASDSEEPIVGTNMFALSE